MVTEGISDDHPVEDIFWTGGDYLALFQAAGMELLETRRPLVRGDEGFAWVNETQIAPWVVYVLRKLGGKTEWRMV
jgi:hypothetical protein